MKGILFTLGLILLLTVGCAKDAAPELPLDTFGQIGFNMEEVNTKASPITTDNIANFGVYCCNTKNRPWIEALFLNTVENNWIQNGEITRKGVEWISNQPYKWAPIKENLTFLAYAPFASPDNGITVPQPQLGDTYIKGVATMGLEIRQDVFTQVDFLISKVEENKNQNSDERFVRFRFFHTLVKVGFRAFCLSPGTLVRRVTLTNMRYKGTIPLSSSPKWKTEELRKDFTIELGGVPLSTDLNKPTDLSGVNRFFMLFPEDFTTSQTSEIVIDYTSNGEEITKSVAVTENWEMGKSFLYTLDLGGGVTDDLIVHQVIIEDWKLGGFNLVDGEALGETYSLIYNANGGTAAPASLSCKQGEMPKISTVVPVKAGSTFVGWNSQSDGLGTTYSAGKRIRMSKDVTLYAIWR